MEPAAQARLLPDAAQEAALPATLDLAPATRSPEDEPASEPGAGVLLVYQAYRFALDPSPRWQRALSSATGGSRFAYNWGLALVKERLDARAAGQDVQVPWTLAALRREWNQAKEQAAPWWAENSREAYSSGLDGLARALGNFSASRAGARKGRRVGFRQFKKRGRARESCRFTTGGIRVEADRNHVTLPKLGTIRTHESTRRLARRLEQGTARVLSATISRRAGRQSPAAGAASAAPSAAPAPVGPPGPGSQGPRAAAAGPPPAGHPAAAGAAGGPRRQPPPRRPP